MDSSRRAVEAYWRSRMVDGVTTDEDKVAPVYKLEEICELLRTSPAGIVKEVSDYILKRLDHQSPIVKQKALRLIKYAVGKSGNEFRREMQRHSVAIRQLFHYKGQLDPLKGDALNKAVRDTAHEAIQAVFATDDYKVVAPVEGLNKRIQGFGNTNFEMPTEDKKSFLSEVVELGSASLRQGLSTIAAAHGTRKVDSGSYRSPNLRRSLTTERDSHDKYQGDEHHRESWTSSGVSENMASGTWSLDSRMTITGTATHEDAGSSHSGVKSHEEKLLETIVTSGGVRLQPTRDALQAFLAEASKLDAKAMSRALEKKLQSHLWQVRTKAICVLESIMRKKDDEHFSIIASYFSENRDSVVRCSQLPQVSLREKAIKVLSLLDGEQTSGARNEEGLSGAKTMPAPIIQMPDLIDTGDQDDHGNEASTQKQGDQSTGNLTQPASLVDDLFGGAPVAGLSTTRGKNEDDPFADVSFHVTEDKEHNDLFSGLTVDDKKSDIELNMPASNTSGLLDVFGVNSEQLLQDSGADKRNVNDLMAGLTLNGMAQDNKQPGPAGATGGAFPGVTFLDGTSQPSQLPTNGALNGIFGSNAMYPQAPMHYGIPPNIMFSPAFAAQPINYDAIGAFIAQHQLLFQNLGSRNTGFGHVAGNANEGGYSLPLPDIFQLSNNPVQSHGPIMNSSKKEETKAFDFISDHLSVARDSKRIL
ncbi:protein MODIFIED TRANSPORT TO THE VACUOLE 1 [Phoenix dactylifera]|uniref:Protein MODIFIED TRANSPORT TO THE VACUOLE 1 n=1 Tax=Phoenix dactylifera TaxID=42345 RepID=A0A8B7CSA5_PHODC|nr:protein MODIFIED TRANSPORT TO THE VACUOLE 1 [Phoenix dactylifera]XP_038986150.1 protein MODIFIED TRANSPORT TO THE VACUOLE 1 [Phoenix dactylifera]